MPTDTDGKFPLGQIGKRLENKKFEVHEFGDMIPMRRHCDHFTMKQKFLIVCLFLGVFGIAATELPPFTQTLPKGAASLFQELPQTAHFNNSGQQAIYGVLSSSWFTDPSQPLLLELPGQSVEAILDRIESVGIQQVYICSAKGYPESQILLAKNGDVLSGHIAIEPSQRYSIRSIGSAVHVLESIDQTGEVCGGAEADRRVAVDQLALSAQLDEPLTALSTSTSTIDVLALYTSAAKVQAGSREAVLTGLAISMARLNLACERSLVNARFRLVAARETPYVETGLSTTDLFRLQASGDGHLDEIFPSGNSPGLKTLFGADLVTLVSVLSDGYGGRAFIYNPTTKPGYSVVGVGSILNGSTTLAHELGHNLGCGHDRAAPYPENLGYYSYSHGYVHTVCCNYFSTIMSYSFGILDNFSNPNVLYHGTPTGISDGNSNSADNARTINQLAPIVASWETSTVLRDPVLSQNDSTFSFHIAGPAGALCKVEYTSDFSNWSTLGTYSLPVSGYTVQDNSVLNVTHRFYRVVPGGVYSVNSVGFLKRDLPAGFTMISNPFDFGDNTLSTLFSAPPHGTAIYKFDDTTKSYAVTSYEADLGGWTSPAMTMNPGEGTFLRHNEPTPFKLRFVGSIRSGYLQVPIVSGLCMRGSIVPQAGALDSVLGFPLSSGDKILTQASQYPTFNTHTFTSSGWTSPPGSPAVGIGEAFFSEKSAATTWTRNFYVNP